MNSFLSCVLYWKSPKPGDRQAGLGGKEGPLRSTEPQSSGGWELVSNSHFEMKNESSERLTSSVEELNYQVLLQALRPRSMAS